LPADRGSYDRALITNQIFRVHIADIVIDTWRRGFVPTDAEEMFLITTCDYCTGIID
jgi:hypothetical protein